MNPVVLSIHAAPPITECALITREGTVLKSTRIPHDPPMDPVDNFAEIAPILEELVSGVSDTHSIEAVGVNGIHLRMESDKMGDLLGIHNYEDADLVKTLIHLSDIPVLKGNPAYCQAWGEKYYGKAKEEAHFMTVYLGDVALMCIMEEQNVLEGHNGLAGNLGEILIDIPGLNTIYGGPEKLSTYVTTTGLKYIAADLMPHYQGKSAIIHTGFHELTCVDIIKAAKNNDELSNKAIQRLGRILGRSLSDLVAISSPDIIYLSGPIAKAEELLTPIIEKTIAEHVFNVFKGKTKVQTTQLNSEQAELLGAAALAWSLIDHP